MAGLYSKLEQQYRDYPLASLLASTTLLGLAWTLNDYREWKAGGTGGTPSSPRGYLRMTLLRLKFYFNDVHDPATLSRDGPSYLKGHVPQRAGGAPKLMPRILPQRQRPEPIPAAVRNQLQGLMQVFAAERPDLLLVKPSHTEGKTTDGLYAKEDIATLNPVAKNKILNHEIAHAHPTDNSLHVWVSSVDARKIIEAGWGARFCLPFVHPGWIMVYAPRDEEELKVIESIVRAAVGWITGVDI